MPVIGTNGFDPDQVDYIFLTKILGSYLAVVPFIGCAKRRPVEIAMCG